MSETFWLALAGIVGTITAAILPPVLQRRHERDKAVAEVYLHYRIEALLALYKQLSGQLDFYSALQHLTQTPTNLRYLQREYLKQEGISTEQLTQAVLAAQPYMSDTPAQTSISTAFELQNMLLDNPSLLAELLPNVLSTALTAQQDLSDLINPKSLRRFN